MTQIQVHPDDLLFFNDVRLAMKRVAKQYELPLTSITAYPMPKTGMANRMGDCNGSGDIRIVLRCTVNGEWCEAPMSPNEVWDTAAHELAHLRYHTHSVQHHDLYLELLQALQNTQEDHRAKVLRKLVKMREQRDGEAKIGNTAAAEAFATAINRMLIEHELNPSDIDYARAADNDPIVEIIVNRAQYNIEPVKRRVAWQETLARVVASGHLCSFLVRPGTNHIIFVGTKSHATVAEYVYGTLVRAAAEIAHKEYCDYWWECRDVKGNSKLASGFKASWLTAFIKRIDERFEEARKAAVAEHVTNIPGSESVALIRLNGALVKVTKYIDDKFSGKKRSASSLTSSYRQNAEGKARGRAAADRMVIGRRGVAGGSGPKGLLS